MLDQPTRRADPERADFDAADFGSTTSSWFTADNTISPLLPPALYAFSSTFGDSMKFQCWQMIPQGGFYSRKGDAY
jgi:hypothetical protein